MHFPSFTIYNYLGTVYFVLSYFAIAKILTLDWKLRLKENIYFILAALFSAAVSVINRDISEAFTHILGDATIVLSAYLYFKMLRVYSHKKTIILTFIASYINLIMTYVVILIFSFSFPYHDASFTPDFLPYDGSMLFSIEALQILSYLPIFVSVTLLFTWLSRKIRVTINQSDYLQTILMYIGIFIFCSFHIVMTILRYLQYVDWLVSGTVLILAISCMVLLLGFYLYTMYMNIRHERQQKEYERKSLEYYVNELERQQVAMRKFKHDYQNILLSLDGFIDEGDLDGLRQYYSSTVKKASGIITKDHFTLEGLHRIKPREIKSILAAKLMTAQNLDMNIRTAFEADQDIDRIPLESTALVRMLGIILDNAIEALTELGGGELRVACLKGASGVTFIVQNTCKSDIPPLYELLRPGFSTKGESRGLGLPNLSELVDAYPNVMLKTNIDKGSFTQRLSIDD